MKKTNPHLSREQLASDLEISQDILRSVVESPKNVVIFALDSEYRYLAFNNNHFQTMKQIWDAEIAVGERMLSYINDTHDRNKAKNNFDRALAGESFIVEEEYGGIELERRYYENNYSPIFNEQNAVIGLTLF